MLGKGMKEIEILFSKNRSLQEEGWWPADKWLVQVERNGAGMVNRRQNAPPHAAKHFFSHSFFSLLCFFLYLPTHHIQIQPLQSHTTHSTTVLHPSRYLRWFFLRTKMLDNISFRYLLSFEFTACYSTFPPYACQHKSFPSLQTYNKS